MIRFLEFPYIRVIKFPTDTFEAVSAQVVLQTSRAG